jgi:hypothetical protein
VAVASRRRHRRIRHHYDGRQTHLSPGV